jgi:site-specific DNA-methyltransferase (adenine-specific)
VKARVIHGDCLEVMRVMTDASVDAIVTDPPYCSGGRQQAGSRNTISKSGTTEAEDWFLGDNMGTDTYLWWMRECARECLRLATVGSQAQVFTDWRQYTTIVTAWESVGWALRSVLVWDKARGGAMGSYWRNNHEWVAIFCKGKPRPLAHRSCFNTWTGSKPQGGFHPTEKPVALMRYLISTVAHDGRAPVVFDPFAGSGTTGVAALAEGCRFVGIERDAVYVEKARRRLAEVQPELAA